MMVQSSTQLKKLIRSLAGEPYKSVQTLQGQFQFSQFIFQFLRIQGSPGAHPASIASVVIPIETSQLPRQYFISSVSRLALADFLIRRFNLGITQLAQQNRGKDGSGSFHTIELGQKMIERDSVLLFNNSIELRFIFSLPARASNGRLFDSDQAWTMFEQELNLIIDFTFFYSHYDEVAQKLLEQYFVIQQSRQEIKRYMEQNGLCVFINNGARLPRQSGVDDKPAQGINVKDFQAPEQFQVTIPLSGNIQIKGLGIKEGITCITGGGYHGKSTLLQAILSGIYAHIPGDGREYIVTRQDAVFIRAEEGRSICSVDISPFIGKLPNDIQTEKFSTDNASGSTSQAASIVEAIESKSQFLLFDEDTCATNFLYRDDLIKKIIDIEKEPIYPLYSTLRSFWRDHNVSMVFVVGGLGSFLQKADTCLLMDNYQCKDITRKVRGVLGEMVEDNHSALVFSSDRKLPIDNFSPSYINKRLKKEIPVRIKDLRNAPKQLEYGMDLINLDAILQIAEAPQMLSIGYCILVIRKEMQRSNKPQTIDYWLQWLFEQLEQYGVSFLQPDYPGTLSLPRKYEVAAAINRVRSLRVLKDG